MGSESQLKWGRGRGRGIPRFKRAWVTVVVGIPSPSASLLRRCRGSQDTVASSRPTGNNRSPDTNVWEPPRAHRRLNPAEIATTMARMSTAARDAFTYDVFISYWHEDREWVATLAGNLERLGVKVWWDGWEIIAGDVVNLELDKGLRQSRCGIIVCSDGTSDRPFVAEEYAALLNKAVGDRGRLIPVIYRLAGGKPEWAGLGVRAWVDFRVVDRVGYESRLNELAEALLERRPERPQVGEPLEYPDLEAEPEWDAVAALTRALMREPNAIVERLDVRLGGGLVPRGSSTRAAAEHVATKIDRLGHGAQAGVRLVGACYRALNDVKDRAERQGARRILREVLSMWLPQRYAGGIAAATRSRSNEPDAVADLRVATRHHEMAALPVAQADKRVRWVSQDKALNLYETREVQGIPRVMPVGAMPAPVSSPELWSFDELADGVADGIGEQIPGQPKATREDRRHDARDWFAHVRDRGQDFDPRHVAVPIGALSERARADLDELLDRLKAHYPALRVVEFEGPGGPEEGKLRLRVLSIFKDDDA